MNARRQIPKWCEPQPFWLRQQGYVLRAPKKAEVGISGALFWFIFWASKK
jgi:hypothetical protein